MDIYKSNQKEKFFLPPEMQQLTIYTIIKKKMYKKKRKKERMYNNFLPEVIKLNVMILYALLIATRQPKKKELVRDNSNPC
jgi:hypothetical protein